MYPAHSKSRPCNVNVINEKVRERKELAQHHTFTDQYIISYISALLQKQSA